MCDKQVEPTMYTDSLALFDVLTKANLTTEKRLMIGLKYVQLSYSKMKIDHTTYVRSEHNITDDFTKIKTDSILFRTLKYGELEHPVGQWIIGGKL